MDTTALSDFIARRWDEDLVPRLTEYIRIPAKSPHFDAKWVENGHIEKVVRQAEAWCREQPIPGLHVEVLQIEGRTPLLFFEVPGDAQRTVMLYGHLDKQPEMIGWREGLGPWEPVYEDGKLYGRGGADDGYAVYASLTALRALAEQKIPHARCIGLIECCEESGSYDLPAYLELLGERLGNVELVIGLDSGCGDYDRLWVTTSLRGLAAGTLSVEVLTEGVHSGDASGVVPSSFRIARHLLDRLENAETGQIIPQELYVKIPEERVRQAHVTAEILGSSVIEKFPFVTGMKPMVSEFSEALLNRTWRPALSVTGANGLPAIATAGNVLRPRTELKLSLRIPPALDGKTATDFLTSLFAKDIPYNAKVSFQADQGATGWDAPPTAPWLESALQEASKIYYQRPAAAMGEGGTIPFMGMLGRQFPKAQFLITGVLGPKSNAHGPNEFLHVPYAKKLTACVAHILAAHTCS